jgi:hypothetical protein
MFWDNVLLQKHSIVIVPSRKIPCKFNSYILDCLPFKQRVAGSNPARPTIKINRLQSVTEQRDNVFKPEPSWS